MFFKNMIFVLESVHLNQKSIVLIISFTSIMHLFKKSFKDTFVCFETKGEVNADIQFSPRDFSRAISFQLRQWYSCTLLRKSRILCHCENYCLPIEYYEIYNYFPAWVYSYPGSASNFLFVPNNTKYVIGS